MSDISEQRRYFERMIDEIGADYRKQIEELKAENTRLRSCLEDASENERLTTHEFDQLKEERDKLRELVQDMHHAIACLVVLGDDYAAEHEDELCALDDRMRELRGDAE